MPAKTASAEPGRLARVLAAARTTCAAYALEALLLAGAAAIVVGVAKIYEPAAWIVGGGMVIVGVWLYVRNGPDLVTFDRPEADD